MDDFRLILLLLGAVVIGAVYLREIVRRRARDEHDEGSGLGGMEGFDGPRVRRRSETPALGELESLDVESVEVEPTPSVRDPLSDARLEAEGVAVEEAPRAPRAADEGGLVALDIDDIDAMASAGVMPEDQADAALWERSSEAPTVVEPQAPAPAARSAPRPPPPPTELASAADDQPPAAREASAPPPLEPVPAEPAVATGEDDPERFSITAERPEQLDLAGLGIAAAETRSGGSARNRGRASPEPAPPEPEVAPEMVIALTVMAREGQAFAGPAVREALENVGLVHGDLQIYHRHAIGRPPGAAATVFSVANVRNPGAIDLDSVEELVTPGLAMFMRIPGPVDAGSAFQQMLEAGRRIAGRLDGVLCDETRSTLTKQSVNHIRERIAEHARRSLLARRS